MAIKDPRFIYKGIIQSKVAYFGWDYKGATRLQHKSMVTFILDQPYIVIVCDKPGFVSVSGFFQFGQKTIYHTQKIKIQVCKQALKFDRPYPKTSKR